VTLKHLDHAVKDGLDVSRVYGRAIGHLLAETLEGNLLCCD